MKIEIADLSGLPEGLKSVVETQDDKHSIDLSKLMVSEDLSGLKSALQKERGNVAAYSKLGTHDEIVAKFADLEAKASKGGKAGEDAQAKLDALTADYDAKLAGKDQTIAKMMKSNAAASLKVELTKAGFIPEAVDDITSTALGRVQFGEDGAPKVMTADGKPMIGSGPDHGATLGDLANELAKAKPYAVRDGGKGGGGKPPNSGGKPAQKRSEMTAEQKGAFQKEHGQEAYLKLPK
ncbi:MAG: hypothetical protein JXR13_18700 [Thalassovita sp.]